MTMISVEKELLQELIDLKLKTLNREIKKILKKWKYTSAETFLVHARDGTITDAEDDAVCLRNLLDEKDVAYKLKLKWSQM